MQSQSRHYFGSNLDLFIASERRVLDFLSSNCKTYERLLWTCNFSLCMFTVLSFLSVVIFFFEPSLFIIFCVFLCVALAVSNFLSVRDYRSRVSETQEKIMACKFRLLSLDAASVAFLAGDDKMASEYLRNSIKG